MTGGILSTLILPLSLFIIMLGLGLSLTKSDFGLVLKKPRAVLLGLACQMIMLPVLAALLIFGLGLSGALAMGLMILALCPGGTTSNLFTFIARGDVALSVTLTAIVSLLAPFTIPIVANWSMEWIMGAAEAIQLPVLETIIKLLIITVLPISIGMVIKRFYPNFSVKAERPIRIFSIVFLALIVFSIAYQNRAQLPEFFAQVGLATLLLNVISMALGFGIAKWFQLSRDQEVCIALEVGIQNGTTALLITLTILQSNQMAIAPTVYSLIMFATGAIFAHWVTRKSTQPVAAE